jgi:hypothetical protein
VNSFVEDAAVGDNIGCVTGHEQAFYTRHYGADMTLICFLLL